MKIKEKILIIEDEANISSFIAAVLEANDYDTMASPTGSKAITMITSHCPDLILLDLGLPDMDGISIIRFVREWSTCPIIVISARNHERDKVEALDAGADDYIVKPFGTSGAAGPDPHRHPPHPYPPAQRQHRPVRPVQGHGPGHRL